MTTDSAGLQYLLDRVAIQDVLTRYFRGCDLGDEAMVRSCFTSDVRAELDQRPLVSGVDALMAQIHAFGKLSSGAWRICTHFMGNLQFKALNVDSAETETNAIAFLVVAEESGDLVHVRSLRYLDRFVRMDNAWKISVRVHTLDWRCEVPSSFALTLSQRLGAIPDSMLSG